MTHSKARQMFEQICAIWDISLEKKVPELVPEDVEHDIYAGPSARGAIPRRPRLNRD